MPKHCGRIFDAMKLEELIHIIFPEYFKIFYKSEILRKDQQKIILFRENDTYIYIYIFLGLKIRIINGIKNIE